MQKSRIALQPLASVVFLTSFCFLALVYGATAQQRAPASNHAIDLAKLFDSVVDTIEEKFFDTAKLKQIDWQARARAVRPSVLAASSTNDAVRRINALLSELKTSHTELLSPDDYDYYEILDVLDALGLPADPDLMARRFWGNGPYYPGTGAFTREIAGHHFVDGIMEGSPAEQAGLKYGDEILSVDGAPYSPIAAFRGKIGTTAKLVIRRHARAALDHLEVSVLPIRPTIAFSSATRASARLIKRDGKSIGYVHVWALAESDSFKSALLTLGAAGAPAPSDSPDLTKNPPLDRLIVDMRGRVGGTSAVSEQLVDAFGPRQGFSWGDLVGRSGVLRTRSASPRSPLFHGRSAVLIDNHTRSAGEVMAYGYERSGFGTLVGTRTAGAVSSGRLFVMPGDLVLYVAAYGMEFDSGQRLEGVGVAPDHLVERPLPYAAGADPVLDAAIDLLNGPTADSGGPPASQAPAAPAPEEPSRTKAPARDILHGPVSTRRPGRAFAR